MNERASFLRPDRNHSVFIHCPLEPEYREHLCALVLAVIASGHGIKGEFDRFDKYNPSLDDLAKHISESKYSIHDCSFCQVATTKKAIQYGRYNLPIELGMAIAERYRIQRIYNKDSESFFHEMFVFVKNDHAYKTTLQGLIKINEICLYTTTEDILKAAFQWLSSKETSLITCPKLEQLKEIWRNFENEYMKNYCQDEGHGVSIKDLTNDILNLCRDTSWWSEPEWMISQYQHDVFLAHNSKDKADILKIKSILEDDFKLKAWIDIDEIQPGASINQQIEYAIPRCRTIAIFFGGNDLGRWQVGEIAVAMARCFEQQTTVIPVLLPSFRDISQLPLFIRTFRWVQFSSLQDTQAIQDLIWGITGKRS